MTGFIESGAMRFYLHEHVYAPKEDSFLLLKALQQEISSPPTQFVEIGGGTGFILLSLLRHYQSSGIAIDINYEATELIVKNRNFNDLPHVNVVCTDGFTCFRKNSIIGTILLFNPPYLPEDPELDHLLSDYELQQLVGGSKGYEALSSFLEYLEKNNNNAILYTLLSSLASTPSDYESMHTQWDMEILDFEEMGFERLWALRCTLGEKNEY